MILLSATLCGSSGIVFGVIYWSWIFASGVSFRHVEEPRRKLVVIKTRACDDQELVVIKKKGFHDQEENQELVMIKKRACYDQEGGGSERNIDRKAGSTDL